MSETRVFYTANDIACLLGISKAKAYQIIKGLNEELEKRGYIVLAGKISKAYFTERWYGGIGDNS